MSGTAIDSNALTILMSLGYSGLGIAAIILIALMFSCYIKVATVLGIVRIGIGFQSLPGAFVTGGLALAISLLVMFPTIRDSGLALEQNFKDGSGGDQDAKRGKALEAGFERWKQFVVQRVSPQEAERFSVLAQKIDAAAPLRPAPDGKPATVQPPVPTSAVPAPEALKAYRESWRVLAPAFIVSELKDAFATGLTIFLPFLLIDLLVATILVGVGYSEVNPVLVALPLKLLLFTVVDGWSVITSNLISTYTS